MLRNETLTKVLAGLGTVLVWIPIVATVLTSVVGSIQAGVFRLDYLMPAELGLFAFAGGGVLLWAAIRAHSRQRAIGWGIGGMAVLLVGSQLLAVITGLASGEHEPSGWRWAMVVAGLAGYVLALLGVAMSGIGLLGDLAGRKPAKPTSPERC